MSSKCMLLGQAPTLWWLLILAACRVPRLDDVRVQRALGEEARRRRACVASSTKTSDELLADDLALALRVGDAGELLEEALLGLDVHEVDLERVAERVDDLLGLVEAQHAVVDEDAGELVADGAGA